MNIYKERDTFIKSRIELEALKSKENEILLEDMLTVRETRVARQNKLLENGVGLIAFTMNIAGPYKNSPAIEKAFDVGISKIQQMLLWHNIAISGFEKSVEKTGCEAYFLTGNDPINLKKLMVQIEDSFELGRLYDIDIIKADGKKVSRLDIGYTQRRCFICCSEGSGCARSRCHTVEQLQQKTVDTICHFFNKVSARNISEKAIKSLLYEVSVTSKPGLVDRLDNGSHRDMDFFTFINSSCCLHDYFEDCAMMGFDESNETPETVFQRIRYLGRVAEDKMYKRTGGVNTHKGAIFSLGIISAALGYIDANGKEQTVDNILSICSRMAKLSISDFSDIVDPQTFGEKLFCDLKLTGIRGQAADGFPSVKNIAYPILVEQIKKGNGFDIAGGLALLHLIAEVVDTNIIKRSSLATLTQIQIELKALLGNSDLDIEKELTRLNGEFIDLNISPGGCADLLSIAFMLYFSIEE